MPNFISDIGLGALGVASSGGNMFNFSNPLSSLSSLSGSGSGVASGIISGASGKTGSAISNSGFFSIATWEDFFLRSVVIILGIIFVAVGLTMFKSATPITIENVSRGTKSIGKKVIGK